VAPALSFRELHSTEAANALNNLLLKSGWGSIPPSESSRASIVVFQTVSLICFTRL
jgi:hypothetical protein